MKEKSAKIAVATANSAPNTAPLLLLGDICENLKKAHDFGYSAIEVHMRENADVDYEKVLNACNELNMKIAAIVTGRLHNEEKVTLIDDDNNKVKIAMDGLKKYIDIANILKTNIIIGWIRGAYTDANKLSIYEERLSKNIKELAIYAMEKGVKIFIEAINRYEINSFNTGKEIIDFIEKYNIPNTYVHLDTFHMNIEEKDIISTIKYCGDKLGYIHFADSNRNYPGVGHLDFKAIMKALDDINYDGYISVECLPKPNHEEAARQAIQHLQQILETNNIVYKDIETEQFINENSKIS